MMRNIDFILLRVTCTAHIHVICNMGRHTHTYVTWVLSTFPAISCQTSMGAFGELLLLRGSFLSMIFFQTALNRMKKLSNYTLSLPELNLFFNGSDLKQKLIYMRTDPYKSTGRSNKTKTICSLKIFRFRNYSVYEHLPSNLFSLLPSVLWRFTSIRHEDHPLVTTLIILIGFKKKSHAQRF